MKLGFNKKLKNKNQGSKNLVKADSAAEQDSENQAEVSNIQDDKIIIQYTGSSPADGGLIVGFFISNGFKSSITCTNVNLILIDSEKHVLARQSFPGDVIGEVGSHTEKACVARFKPKNVFTNNIPRDSQLCFDLA